jgi:hypothetical protein
MRRESAELFGRGIRKDAEQVAEIDANHANRSAGAAVALELGGHLCAIKDPDVTRVEPKERSKSNGHGRHLHEFDTTRRQSADPSDD